LGSSEIGNPPSKRIIEDVNRGREEVVTTVVHVSEVVNILKKGMTGERLTGLVRGLFMKDNISILDVTSESYLMATELGGELGLDPNDALAVDIMRARGVREIYSFDEHFDNIEGITRLPGI
jgi:predicted nucleic acid-binding protein